jgi:hypothetical protein
MTEFLYKVIENREYIQRDMDLFHAYQALASSAQTVTTEPWVDPWAEEEQTNG